MVDLPEREDVYSVVERDYDLVQLAFHDSYDATAEFAPQTERFSGRLRAEASVLVVGGSVSECVYFRDGGFVVTNLDLSARMVEHVAGGAKVQSVHGNILTFANGSFDGVWACRSLIHLHPEDLVRGLQSVRGLLACDGLFGCILFTGRKDVQQQVLPEHQADGVDVVYYRCLYSEKRIHHDFAAAGLQIVHEERCADQDGDGALFVEAIVAP